MTGLKMVSRIENFSSNNDIQSPKRNQKFYVNLSKNMAYALRHNPEQCGLLLNSQGYTNTDALLKYLQTLKKFSNITIQDIKDTIANIKKKRFELKDNIIRAYYGHSCQQKIEKHSAIPPKVLYHGTSCDATKKIFREGLKPQRRQYVHMSTDTETAYNVGSRKDKSPTILIIDTKKATRDGINFYLGNESTWLSDYIPPKYIKNLTAQIKITPKTDKKLAN